MDDRLPHASERCTLAATLEIVGDRWTLLVVREALRGVCRFDRFAAATGCARNILSTRLTRLVDHGILARVPYRDGTRRERSEYRLTEKGRELSLAIVALMRWGDRHLAGPDGPPLDVVHTGCDAPVRARLSCDRHGLVPPRVVSVRPKLAARRIARSVAEPPSEIRRTDGR